MRILFIGDIVAKPGREIVNNILPEIKVKESIDLVIANVENLSGGKGVTRSTLKEMQDAGVDFFTGGDHIFWQKEVEDCFQEFPLIRPANYPSTCSGEGYEVLDTGRNGSVLIANLIGRTSFGGNQAYTDDPFTLADKILSDTENLDIAFSLIDFHAEATSEKQAFAYYLDGRVGAVCGTHTHVPTCDERVLPSGTMYVTDAGMTGNIDSVLGVKKEIIIQQYLTAQNQRFEWENTGKKAFRSVIIDTDSKVISRLDRISD